MLPTEVHDQGEDTSEAKQQTTSFGALQYTCPSGVVNDVAQMHGMCSLEGREGCMTKASKIFAIARYYVEDPLAKV